MNQKDACFISHRVQTNCTAKEGFHVGCKYIILTGMRFLSPQQAFPISQTTRCHVAIQIPKTIAHRPIPINKQQPFVRITYIVYVNQYQCCRTRVYCGANLRRFYCFFSQLCFGKNIHWLDDKIFSV